MAKRNAVEILIRARDEASKVVEEVTGNVRSATTETQQHARTSQEAISGIGAAFGAVVASKGVQAYVAFLQDTATLAHQAESAHRLFHRSLERTNQSLSAGDELVNRLSQRFGVANSVIEESATLMLRQGASLEDVERALTSAGASAAAAGFDISTAFDNVATAVATGRSELLETSGIVSNLGPAEQAYARAIGKTVSELTQQERIQARVNAIFEETKSEIEDLDILLEGLPTSQANWTKELRTFQETAGGLSRDVLVPILDAGTGILQMINGLPEPVIRAGSAMTGAAVGATALASGITAIRLALRGLSGAGLLSFGPAGWVVLGATAVAGLAAALAGRKPDSLERAIQDASDAVASNDAKSLDKALERMAQRVDGPVKTAIQELREELERTGDTAVATGEKLNAITAQAKIAAAQAEVAAAAAELEAARNAATSGGGGLTANELLGPLRDRVTRLGRADLAEALVYDPARNMIVLPPSARGVTMDVVDQIMLANSQLAENVTNHADTVAQAEAKLAQAWENLEKATNPPTPTPTPTPTPEPDPGPAGTPTDPITVEVAERSGRPIAPSTRRAMDLAEAGGPGAGMSTGMTPAELQAALAARRAHNDAVARLEREAEVMLELHLRGQRRELEVAAAVNAAREQARETLQGLGEGVLEFVGGVREARDAVVDARWADSDAELERFMRNAAGLTDTLKAAADAADTAARMELFAAAQARYGTGDSGLAGTSAAGRGGVGPAVNVAEQSAREVVEALVAANAPIEAIRDAVDFWTSITPQSVATINEVTNGLLQAARAADNAARRTIEYRPDVREFDENPGLADLGDTPPVPRSVALGVTPGANVMPDLSHLSDEQRAQVLQQEMEARQGVIDGLLQLSTEKGALGNFGAGLLNLVADSIPAFGAALTGFVQAGPIGAVVAVFTELLSSSKVFADVLDMVNQALEPLVRAAGTLLEAFLPIIEPLLEFVAFLGEINAIMAGLIAPALQFVGNIINAVVDALIAVWNFILGWIPGLRIERPDIQRPTDDPDPDPRRSYEHSSDPPRNREPDFGRVGPGVQLAVATPLVEAAQLSLTAAQLQVTAANSLASVFTRVEALYTRLLEEGFRVKVELATPAAATSSGTAFLR